MMRQTLRRLAGCTSGMAAVEFAMVLPVLCAMYLGGQILSDEISCQRKVTVAARELTDLTTRYAELQQSDIQTILGASSQVLSPYNAANALIRISEVQVVDATHVTLVWSQAVNGTALTTGTNTVVSSNLTTAAGYTGTCYTYTSTSTPQCPYLIYGEVSYNYTPAVQWQNYGAMAIYDAMYMSPRLSANIPLVSAS